MKKIHTNYTTMELSSSDEFLETNDIDETILTIKADPIKVNKGRDKATETNLDEAKVLGWPQHRLKCL